jgi:hypothetical protein
MPFSLVAIAIVAAMEVEKTNASREPKIKSPPKILSCPGCGANVKSNVCEYCRGDMVVTA